MSDHNSLCQIASRWLKKSLSNRQGMSCQISFVEPKISFLGGESPDAIGFRIAEERHMGGCTIIECKTSMSDFLADMKKPHRLNPEIGMGRFRYYMCPEGLIPEERLPAGWGLLYVGARKKVVTIKGACQELRNPVKLREFDFVDRNKDRETLLLANIMHRIGNAEDLNNRLREADRATRRLIANNTRLTEENTRVNRELLNLKFGRR